MHASYGAQHLLAACSNEYKLHFIFIVLSALPNLYASDVMFRVGVERHVRCYQVGLWSQATQRQLPVKVLSFLVTEHCQASAFEWSETTIRFGNIVRATCILWHASYVDLVLAWSCNTVVNMSLDMSRHRIGSDYALTLMQPRSSCGC